MVFMDRYDPLQLREVFHIEFLRWFGRKVKPDHYAVKGGVNLRFFFGSFRYSEDMDLDARGIGVGRLKDTVMDILGARAFQDNLKPFGIARVAPPDIAKAKQTETTQRFKIHLISIFDEDLFTKIEFSRRGFAGKTVLETIDNSVLRAYKLAPLLAPHYDIHSSVEQKIAALALRKEVQARDIFDLYVLGPRGAGSNRHSYGIGPGIIAKAHERIFEVDFEQFRDTVVSYLAAEDQAVYNNPESWEDVRLKVAGFIEEAGKAHA